MKIAVPVESDKSTIAKKTGQAGFFAIYENDKVVDYVKNRSGQGGGNGNGNGNGHGNRGEGEGLGRGDHNNGISGLADCDVILVQVIGEHMKESLQSMGIDVKKVRQKDGTTADEVVKNFLANNI